MARISLINPAISLVANPEVKEVDIKMPMGLLYIASSLVINGHTVQFIDASLEGLGASDIIIKLKEFNPQFVGITCMSVSKGAMVELSRLIKSSLAVIPEIIIGGVHPTLAPDSCLQESSVDYVIVGEGEHSFAKLCDKKSSLREIPGLYYRDDNGFVVSTGPPKRITNLDMLPYPAYSLLNLEKYLRNRESLCLIASRGCAYNCTYCCSPRIWKNKIIFREPTAVVDEVKYYLTIYPTIRTFHFLDDNFTLWGDGLDKFCSLIKNLDIQWRCIGSIDHLDEQTIKKMAESGCCSISFGIESASDRIQHLCRKNVRLDIIPHRINLFSRAGIKTKAFFMFGFPGETETEIYQTIKYSVKLRNFGLNDAAFMALIPYPGTKIYEELTCQHKSGFGESVEALDWFDASPLSAKRLAKYRAFPVVSANENYSGMQLRVIAAHAYDTFYDNNKTDYKQCELHNVISNGILDSAANNLW